jgi:hypothetical protein
MTFRKRKQTEEQIEAIELERVEWVVRVELGSLERRKGFGLSYDGCPEWLEKELQEEFGWDATFCTVVTDGGGYQSAPKEEIVDAKGQRWILIRDYAHGAETECPVPENHHGAKVTREECVLVPDPYRHHKSYEFARPLAPNAVRAECPMCEARLGEEHGYIYIGEGYEAVYRLHEPVREAQLAFEGRFQWKHKAREFEESLLELGCPEEFEPIVNGSKEPTAGYWEWLSAQFDRVGGRVEGLTGD